MCSEPVTLGGGIDITNGTILLLKFGLKYPWDSHLIPTITNTRLQSWKYNQHHAWEIMQAAVW